MASTSPDRATVDDLQRPPPFQGRRRVLTGWGLTPPSAGRVIRAYEPAGITEALADPPDRGVIARGLGRSYGDAAQNAGGRVIDVTGTGQFHLDIDAGRVTASAGASLDELMRALVPRGWFVPVTPGTRYVTVGGAIAADIHGKNHHHKGSWCDHVESLRLAIPDGSVVELTPSDDLFWATAGGMGLTGVVVDATFRCLPIESSRLLVDTDRATDLDHVLQLMVEGDHRYDYSVAWIDLMATGRQLGRSVLTRGRFARIHELPPSAADDPLLYDPAILLGAPPIVAVPSGLLNRLTIRAFNEVWFRKAPVRRTDEIQDIPTFFHPLDMVRDWNRMYGRRGFLQWQCVVPLAADATLRRIVERLSTAGCTSLVNVLKRFGPGNRGHLSFPIEGWTLSVDIPVSSPQTGPLLDRLDEEVTEVGGRLYLAKDSRVRPELLPVMYPRLDEWRELRHQVDPDCRLRSDLARRLGL